jgi:hypothetical protein
MDSLEAGENWPLSLNGYEEKNQRPNSRLIGKAASRSGFAVNSGDSPGIRQQYLERCISPSSPIRSGTDDERLGIHPARLAPSSCFRAST